jgi:hypothetical protein
MRNRLTLFSMVVLVSACSSLVPQGRRFLDSSTREDSPPGWVRETKMTWERAGKVFLHSFHSIRGDERVNGCFDLARLDNKEALLSEIADEVKGSIDNAQQSISENAEEVLGKVRSAEFSGRITGLRFTDQYYERYLIGETERVDCHVLSEIKETDYNRIKREVVDKIAEVDPRLKEAISKKQIDFFSNGKQSDPAPQKNDKANDSVKELKDGVKSELEHYFKPEDETKAAMENRKDFPGNRAVANASR